MGADECVVVRAQHAAPLQSESSNMKWLFDDDAQKLLLAEAYLE